MNIAYKGVTAEVEPANVKDEIVRKFWSRGQFYEARPGELLEWLSEQRGEVFVDVGAHWGNHTLFALMSGNFERAVCFEPDPVNAAILRSNLEANVGAWAVVEVALSSEIGSGRMVLPANGTNNSGMMTLERGEGSVRVGILDQLGGSCDVLKIDAERHELEVLKGGTEFIARTRPKIAIEVMDEQYPAVHAQLQAMGYAMNRKLTNRTPTYIYLPW